MEGKLDLLKNHKYYWEGSEELETSVKSTHIHMI